jgi:hypothetical protein
MMPPRHCVGCERDVALPAQSLGIDCAPQLHAAAA